MSETQRLTDSHWQNLDPWEMCGNDKYCTRDCHEEGGCTRGCKVVKLYKKLALYEDKEDITEVHDAKVRAEAIDECIAKIVEFNSDGYEVWWHTMCNILEQLKEQRNEN